ncbi:hypothetical protein F2Q68_00024321 [Brassica cretica]|uniref:Uncharacterized protein n=1 Tax=Brassica cretica TaxID=69181 RepID=A0A8S9I8B3_BRACR|nr:hypothetical protein F2Q68_00024321 [Brassica cretica]
MAGVKPLTEEDKEVISLYGKPITLYGILQAFTQDKGVKHHLTSSHALFDFNFRLSENGHPMFDVSVKPDAFKNGVLNYDLEEHDRVNIYFYRLRDSFKLIKQMAGVRPLTEEDKEVISLYGKPITFYGILQAFTQDKPRFLPRCLSYKIQARKNKMYESLLRSSLSLF